jgi:hypothetical protein
MSEKELRHEIEAVKELMADDARELVELSEELIDLEEHARLDMHVPHSRRYRIRVNGEYYIVESAHITDEAILRLAGLDLLLVWEVIQHFRDGRQEIVPAQEQVSLRAPGVERFTTAAKMVRITVDSRPVEIQAGKYIVAAFKAIVGVEPSRALDQVIGGEFRELSDEQGIRIVAGEIFVSHVRKGQSS